MACDEDITAGTDVDLITPGFVLVGRPPAPPLTLGLANESDDGVDRLVVGVVLPGVRDLRLPANRPCAGETLVEASVDLIPAVMRPPAAVAIGSWIAVVGRSLGSSAGSILWLELARFKRGLGLGGT